MTSDNAIQSIMDLPLEIHEAILWRLRHDSFALHRVERVCLLWKEIVARMERKIGSEFRRIKVSQVTHFIFEGSGKAF